MPANDAIAEARDILVQRRDELTSELSRITQALEALTGVGMPPNGDGIVRAPSQSVRSMLLALLDESNRDWSTYEILAEYQRRGTPIHGADPNNALRSAISDANKATQVFRTTPGRYKAIKWKAPDTLGPPPAAANPAANDEQGVTAP